MSSGARTMTVGHSSGTGATANRRQAIRLALGTASALGLARFAYGLLLPAMRADMHWSLTRAGSLTFANGLGYIVGAAFAASCIRRWNTAATFRAGMLLIAVALAANAGGAYSMLFAARAVAGFAGALVFIAGGVIAAGLATKSGSASPITIYFSGTGAGIVISAVAIPPILDHRPDDWQLGWVLLAGFAALAALLSWSAAGDGNTTALNQVFARRRVGPLWRTAAAYLLFAAGYIAYITFLSAFLAEKNVAIWQEVLNWGVLGGSVIVNPWLWSKAIGTWPRARALTTVLILLTASAAAPLISASPPVVLASAVGYGVSFMAVPAAVTALIRVTTKPADWAATLAAFTIIFAAGQTVGPIVAGTIADHMSPAAALGWTAVLCCAAAVFAAFEPARHDVIEQSPSHPEFTPRT